MAISSLVKEVPGLADQADSLLPGRAAPSVLKGRAWLKLGRAEDALAALQEAARRDQGALEDPVAQLTWARANARTRHFDVAAQAFRAVLPRTSSLSRAERSSALFEAGMSVMTLGPKSVDDAVGMFRQARREAEGAMEVAAYLGLALALERAGQTAGARALLEERLRFDLRASLSEEVVAEALADAGVAYEAEALLATALEHKDSLACQAAWKAYVEGPGGQGAWGNDARAKIAKPIPKPPQRAPHEPAERRP